MDLPGIGSILMSDYICSVSMQLWKTEGTHMLIYRACLVTSLSYVILWALGGWQYCCGACTNAQQQLECWNMRLLGLWLETNHLQLHQNRSKMGWIPPPIFKKRNCLFSSTNCSSTVSIAYWFRSGTTMRLIPVFGMADGEWWTALWTLYSVCTDFQCFICRGGTHPTVDAWFLALLINDYYK